MQTYSNENKKKNQPVLNGDQTGPDSFHKKLPFPSDPDMGEHNPLVAIPDIRDEVHTRHSNENNGIENILMQLQHKDTSDSEQNKLNVQQQSNQLENNEIIYPSSAYRPVFGDADSNRNEFSTED